MDHRAGRLFSSVGLVVLAAACAAKPMSLAPLAPMPPDSLRSASEARRVPSGPPRAAEALNIGDRVRITVPALGLQDAKGSLQGVRADTLFVQLDSERIGGQAAPKAIAVGAVSRLAVRRHLVGHVTAEAGGTLTGAALGGVLVYNAQRGCASGLAGWRCAWNRVGRAFLGGMVGGVVGWLVGGALVPQQWEWVSPEGLQVAFSVQDGGGVGLRVSAAF